jgi:hypothetical protein
MIQLTENDGSAWPLAFDITEKDGSTVHVVIDRVIHFSPQAELTSGIVGDRYEVEIDGRREFIYYSILRPRKWFVIEYVSKEVYDRYYKYPNEKR